MPGSFPTGSRLFPTQHTHVHQTISSLFGGVCWEVGNYEPVERTWHCFLSLLHYLLFISDLSLNRFILAVEKRRWEEDNVRDRVPGTRFIFIFLPIKKYRRYLAWHITVFFKNTNPIFLSHLQTHYTKYYFLFYFVWVWRYVRLKRLVFLKNPGLTAARLWNNRLLLSPTWSGSRILTLENRDDYS